MSDDLFDEDKFGNNYFMIGKDGCSYCDKTVTLFNILGVPVSIKKVVTDEERQAFVREGHRTFPRIFKNGKLVGGYDDFKAYVADLVGNK